MTADAGAAEGEWRLELKVIKTASRQRGPVNLFLVQKNESYFLPHFFAHYRKLGVGNFLVYDDGSTDGSTEYLRAQRDCTVITSDIPYGASVGSKRFGNLLKIAAPNRFFAGEWVLTADADEFLILPPGIDSLPDLISMLEERDFICATAALVDFYPSRLSQRDHSPVVDPFSANPFFDAGPLYDWKPGKTRPDPLPAGYRGIRYRISRMLLQQNPEKYRELYGNQRIMPLPFKVPLLKHGLGVLPAGAHRLTVPPQLEIVLAFAHFKFFPGLDAKITHAVANGQYWGASVDYKMLGAAIETMNERSLVSSESRIFLGPQSLADNGYLR